MDTCSSLATSLAVSIGTFFLPIPPRPMPPGKAKGATGYPFAELAVNDHLVVANRGLPTVRQAIRRYYLRHGREKRFYAMIGPSGHPTVWRVK